jgi:two-component system cell cycle response regulator
VERRAVVGIVLGVAGLAAGLLGALTGAPAWGATAAASAAGAGLAAGLSGVTAGAARAERDRLEARVAELEAGLRRESAARAELEAQLSSRIKLTAMRRSTERDALTDGSTGLFSEGYFTVALDTRISAARRNLRPVAVVLMEVIEGLDTGRPRPAEPREVASSILETIREADTACRLLDGGYALVLEDTTENGAIWTVERIRRRLNGEHPNLTLWAGVACYPAHGLSTDEVLDRADLALDMAREWRQDRIEVATAEN